MRKGIAEVVGVRRRVLVGFSRRRAEIEAALDRARHVGRAGGGGGGAGHPAAEGSGDA